MPVFLVHGVPDTHRLWDRMRAHLARKDVLAPDLPGFGAPTPPGFVPVKESYVDWLLGELEQVGEPVDLVGHDWGSILVQRAVSLRPDLVRTWACGNGPVDREYVWHDMARQWQTPSVGEAVMAAMVGDAMVAGLVASGVPAELAPQVVSRIDARMKECILGLYRSAVKVGEEWEDGVAKVTRPALVLWSRHDPFVAPRFAERLAARVRGRLHFLEGCGHFWPHERPAEAAAALEEFWAAQSRAFRQP
jgi:pimeloyl-ACP methyl ester carboxylesterase